MKLGLLGYPVEHSLSPKLYKDLLGDELESYEKFSYPKASDIPPLSFFASKLDGLNITSPYKTHFIPDVKIDSESVRALGIINTISFKNTTALATNTDLVAVEEILRRYKNELHVKQVILLGDGAMARLTRIVAQALSIDLDQLSRRSTQSFSQIDLRPYSRPGRQTLIINSCSRDFIFQGEVTGDEIFWDYNYSFLPHQNTLPYKVKTYVDGQEMLLLQAKAALNFWSQVK